MIAVAWILYNQLGKSRVQLVQSGPILKIPPGIVFRGGPTGSAGSFPSLQKPSPEEIAAAKRDVQTHSNDPKVLNDAGCLLQGSDEKETGLDLLAKAHQLAPEDPIITYNYARGLYGQGKAEEATQQAQAALQRKPDLDEAHILLADVATQKKDYDAADQQLKNLANVMKEIKVAALTIQAAILMGKGKVQEAYQMFEQALAMDQQDPTSLYNAGLGSQMLGNLPRAQNYYQQALQLDPNLAEAHNNLGTVMMALGQLQQGLQQLQAASSADPSNNTFVSNLKNAEQSMPAAVSSQSSGTGGFSNTSTPPRSVQPLSRLPIEGTWKGVGTVTDDDGLLAPHPPRPTVMNTTGLFIIRSHGRGALFFDPSDKGLAIRAAEIEPKLQVELVGGVTENLQPDDRGVYSAHIVFKGGLPAPEIERQAERLRGNPVPHLMDDVEWDATLEVHGSTAKLRFVMSEFRFGTRRLSNRREIAYSLEKVSDELPDLHSPRQSTASLPKPSAGTPVSSTVSRGPTQSSTGPSMPGSSNPLYSEIVGTWKGSWCGLDVGTLQLSQTADGLSGTMTMRELTMNQDVSTCAALDPHYSGPPQQIALRGIGFDGRTLWFSAAVGGQSAAIRLQYSGSELIMPSFTPGAERQVYHKIR